MKLVVDVPTSEVGSAKSYLLSRSLDAHEYYGEGATPANGGAAGGWTRLGAEAALHDFNDAERQQIHEQFENVLANAPFRFVRVAVETWEAGDVPYFGAGRQDQRHR